MPEPVASRSRRYPASPPPPAGISLVKIRLPLALLLATSCAAFAGEPPDEPARAWAATHATSLGSLDLGSPRQPLSPLRDIVGDARIVSVGEAMHGGHEFLALRNRIFEYLVEEMGFTALAAETDFVDGAAIDDYINGSGELTEELVAGVFSFSAPEQPEENRALLRWMRAYNSRPGIPRKIHFYGLEMMGRALQHSQPIPARPLAVALTYVSRMEPEAARELDARVGPALRALKETSYESLSAEHRDTLTLATADLTSLFERRQVRWVAGTSRLEYERAYRSALNARALDADMRIGGWWRGCGDAEACDMDQRDAHSAENFRWVLDQEGARGRVMLFAHNTHVRSGPVHDSKGRPDFTSLGQHLHSRYPGDIVVIGSFYARASGFAEAEEESPWYDPLTGPLGVAKMSGPRMLNLRALPSSGPVAAWWNRRVPDVPQDKTLNPVECFDAIVLFPVATPWRVPTVRQRDAPR
jgi:erythromycin esterase